MLNGQNLSWTKVNAGVPQRSILGPLIFLNSEKRHKIERTYLSGFFIFESGHLP